MRLLSLLIVGLALLVVLSGTVSAEYEGDLTVLWTSGLSDNVNAVFVADLDNDGQKEVIAGTRDNKVYLLDSDGNIKWFKSVGSAVRCVCAADTDGDGIKEVIAGTDYKDLGKVYAFDTNGNLQWTFQTGAKHYWPDNKLNVRVITAGDVDNDGKEEVVVGSTHYYWFPGRICVLGENGNLEGEYWNPGYVSSIEIADLENDGSNEIIAGFVNNDYGYEGAVAVFDGDNVGGEGPAWVNGFNYDAGTQRWYWHSGVDYSNIKSIYAFDVDSDGDKEIACGSSDNRVYLLNSNGGVVWNYATAGTVYSVYAADIDDDGKGEILAGSSDKNVYCIEHTKSLKWKYQTGGSVIVPFAGDIDNDGASEIVAVSDKVYVLNSAGELKYSYSGSGKAYVADLGTDGRKEVILGSGASVYALATTVVQLPDLTLSPDDITFSNPNPVVGDEITIRAEISNTGDDDANDVIVQFFNGDLDSGGVQIGDDQVLSFVAAGSSEMAQVNWVAEEGTHEIYVIIDPNNDISESNEDNNKAYNSVVVAVCPWNAQQKLLYELNYWFADHGYDFYEVYYDYNDNAVEPDPEKRCYLDLEDDDIWINYFSSTSPAFYPSSAYLFGPEIGVDTNRWYSGGTPVRGITYPELELDSVDQWFAVIPFVGEDIEQFLEALLEGNEWGIELDGVYSQGKINWEEDTNRSTINTKFAGSFVGPADIVEGGNCQLEFIKYYDADTDQFGNTLPTSFSCSVDVAMPVKRIGYSKNISVSAGAIGFDGAVAAEVELSPSAAGGTYFGFGEPQSLMPAGDIEAGIGLDANATGELCLPFIGCDDTSVTLPVPTVDDVEFVGESVMPFVDFQPGDSLTSLYPNPDGSYVTYEDLDALSPVFRVATSEIDVNYELCFNLTELNIPCDGFLLPPCNICLFEGPIIYIEPWEGYWSFTDIVVHSPVNIHLYDSLGRHIGLNDTGGIELQIPNSSYTEVNETKIIKFPTTIGRFVLLVNGTDEGNYTLTISRPLMIVNNGNKTIKGITYKFENVSTFEQKIDFYNLDFDEIEQKINGMVEEGMDVDEAIEESSNLVVRIQNATKSPSTVFSEDVFGYNGDKITLYARLTSLNEHLNGQIVYFSVDGEIIGSNVTNGDGETTLEYTIPHGIGVGVYHIQIMFNGNEDYYNSTGYAYLHILNKRPEVSIDTPSFPSGKVWVNGSVFDSNLESVELLIDNETVPDYIPYLWDTNQYANGYHLIKLIGTDSFGEKGVAIAYVFVHNPNVTISANVTIKPETLNLASKGVFTAFIQLSEGYDVADINVSTVECEGAQAIREVGDSDMFIAKFNRQDLIDVPTVDEVELTVTGELYDGTPFEGSDTIRVIKKGGKK